MKGFGLLFALVVILTGTAGFFVYQTTHRESTKPHSPVSPDINLPKLPTAVTTKEGAIEGKITLNYKIPEFPNIQDDISVLISERNENEANYFSAVNCAKNKDNCVWLISESKNKRIYGYRLTMEGLPDLIRVGEKYKVYVSIRHYNNRGNIAGTESDKVSLTIPDSGTIIQDFNLTVIPL